MDRFPAGGPFRPDPAFAAPERLRAELRARILPLVNRPARYLGGERGAAPGPWRDGDAHVLLCFPDAYELGISNTGLRILYARLLEHPRTFADTCFTPWPDMEQGLREAGAPLFGLQTCRPAADFDLIGFSLGYELGYTNVLTMLDLAGLPLLAADRDARHPLVVAGGHAAANPAVMAPFFDVFAVGDGEDLVCDLADLAREARAGGLSRDETLARARAIPGVWTPAAPAPVRARVVADLDAYPPPANLVPNIEAVHDRLSIEVMRGCARGCRFCQAGMITRPVRERDVAGVIEAAVAASRDLGWNEVSLLSLSSCDYSGLGPVLAGLRERLAGTHTGLDLPSLRADALDDAAFAAVGAERPTTFTFAPEAGSQRLRDVINKNVTEEDLLTSVRRAFAAGAKKVKLYFMLGLPTETDADLDAAVDLVGRVVRLAPRGGSQVTVSFSPFAPKAHTPFQWSGQVSAAEIARRNDRVREGLRRMKVKVSLRDPAVSRLEAALGIGDGRLGEVVARAWSLGARFDGWEESFRSDLWERAFAEAGVDQDAYLGPRDPEAPLPWDGIFAQVDRDFLRREWERAQRAEAVPDCRLEGGCEGCEACTPEHDHVFAADVPAAAAAPVAAEPTESDFDPRNADPETPGRERARWTDWRRRAPGKCWYRAVYAKTGDARFLGHLDLQRQLQLALRRSGLPVAYSQGFHPHPLLKFGPPLPLGVEGEREVLDVAFISERPGWEDVLNDQLPAGLRFAGSELAGPILPVSIEKGIARLDYAAELPAASRGGPDREFVSGRIAAFMAADRWPWLRRRPKGDVEVDARPLICGEDSLALDAAAPDGADGVTLSFSLLRESGLPGLPAQEFLAALLGEALPEPAWCRIRRTGLFARRPDGCWVPPLAEVSEWNRRFWLRTRMCA